MFIGKVGLMDLVHHLRIRPSALEALDRLEGREDLTGFLELVDSHESVNKRQKTVLFVEQSLLFQSVFFGYVWICLHLLMRHFCLLHF
jgi:hypothetical protein